MKIPFLLPVAIALALLGIESHAFSPAGKVVGEGYPHILKTESYTLNTRNVKALKSQGKYLWLGTSMGAIRYDTTTPEAYQVFDNSNGLLSNGIFNIIFDKKGAPWLGTYGGGLSHWENKRWVNYNTPNGLCDAFVYDVEFADDAMWIATWSGVNRVKGNPRARKSWESFTTANTNGGLIDNWVYAIEIGKDKRVWFGTESGISMYDGQQWRGWNHSSGLGAPLELVKQENTGTMPSFQGSHHSHQPPPDIPNTESNDYRPNYVVSMLLDTANNLWIGTWGGGLSLFDTQNLKFRNFTTHDGLPGNFILALKQDRQGNLWIGSNRGLSRFDGKTFTNYSKLNGLIGDFVFSIEFGNDHSLWVGSHNGMNRLYIDPLSQTLTKSE
jgi:ligand-binding sensor domain-containing protein